MTEVVAALIQDGGKWLIGQRPAHKARGLHLEFVGGKVEPGETQAQALARETGLVVAAGGGALVRRENAECLGRTGVIVLLDAPLEELKKRLKNDASRPLLQKPDRDAVIEALHRERMPLYRQAAHLTVPAGGPPLAVAHEVLRQVKSGG